MDGFWTSTKAWVIGVAVGMVVVGACGGAIAFGVLKATEEVGEGKAVMTTVLRSISERDYPTAYGYLSEELQAELSLSEFGQSMQQQQGAYAGFDGLDTQSWFIEVESGQKSQLTYGAKVKYVDGSEASLDAVLVRESGDWKVLAFRLSAR